MLNLFPIFLVAYEFTLYLSNDMYLPAFPAIVQEFATQEALVQYTLTSWLLGNSVAQLFLGPYSDRVGRRPVIIGSGILFILTCLGCYWAKSIAIFVVLRFLQGATVCSIAVAGYAAIHESFAEKQAVKLIALMSMAAVLAPMFGPLIGGYVITHYQWRMIFIVLLLLSIIVAFSLFFTMPETLQNKNRTAMTLKNLWEEYSEVIKNRQFMTYSLMFGVYYTGIVLWMTIGPFYLMGNYQLTPKEFGLSQIPTFAGFVLGAQLVRVLSEKFTLRQLTLLGISSGFLSTTIIVLAILIQTRSPLLIIIGMGIYGLGFGTLAAPLNRLAFNATKGGKGVVNAVYCSCMLLIGSMASIVVSLANDNSRIVWFAISLITIVLINILGFKRST